MSRTPTSVRRAPLRSRSRLAAVLAPAALLASGCTARDAYENTVNLGFPEPVTPQGEDILRLWHGSVAASLVIGAAVAFLILFAAVKYRKKSDQLPRQVRYNLPIEVLYTAVPFVIILVLFYYTTVSQNFVNKLTPDSEGGAEVEIGVVGFQWNWTFRYEDERVQTTGETDNRAVLVLPTDTTIRFTETSPDVIHSFFVPAFLFKRDVIPGRANQFEISINKEGKYVGRCAELCGEKHSAMNFEVRAVSPDAYRAYIEQLKANPDNAITSDNGIGAVKSAADAQQNPDGSSE